MPPKKKRAATQSNKRTRQSTRLSRQDVDHIPDVYSDMLAEAAYVETNDFTPSPRALKRRKLGEETEPDLRKVSTEAPNVPDQSPPSQTEASTRPQQIVYDDFEVSDDSDVEFEDVDIDPVEREPTAKDDRPEQQSIQIDLSKPAQLTPQKSTVRRKPVTKAERDFRLDVHKWHVLSLISHGRTRSLWCDDEVVHVTLKQLVPKKVISLLHVDEVHPSYQRNHSFLKGIEEVCAIWKQSWTIDARGLRRAHWSEGVDAQQEFDKAEDPVDLDDFRLAAKDKQGSRDLGAQLFTALLRSLALDARLVFSMQVLPFSGVAKGQTPEKPRATYIEAPPQVYGTSPGTAPKRKKIRDSPYPVFWTEVLNPATSSWIALDPLVRNTINKPKTQFEPPAADPLNQMTYVIAFEDDHTVHDVTRRYTQWFNAKTRKLRIESTKGGAEWWKKAMHTFKRFFRLPRDKIEVEYLAQRSAAEGMPKNVQDFKNHPVYVLERHLRSNEVIHPKREVGKFSAGTGKNTKVESVYRAQDLYACRTADAWYRRGRDVKLGQQPLKRAVPKLRRGELEDEDDDNDEEREGVALYAQFQTEVYQPPPVEHGRIPKNAYGNLDVYVPSMIPAGAVHISHQLSTRAAKVLGIDYADAVTGFVFKGRQGTAVINGAVVAAEFTAAMIATIEGLEWLGTQEVQAARTKIILGIWKRMLTALRIHEKIENEYGSRAEAGTEVADNDHDDDEDSTYTDDEVEDGGGGFMLEADQNEEKTTEQAVNLQALKSNLPVVLPDEVIQQPIKVTISPHTMAKREPPSHISDSHDLSTQGGDLEDDIFGTEYDDPDGGGGFMPDDAEAAGGGFTSGDGAEVGGFTIEGEGEGGGFMDEAEVEAEGGGFIPDNEDTNTAKTQPVASVKHPDPPPPDAGDPKHESPSAIAGNKDTSDRTGSDGHNAVMSSRIKSKGKGTARIGLDEPQGGNGSDGSLLSHDPDEDDDEPEWLDDAFDSE